jgi:hypothetical protein
MPPGVVVCCEMLEHDLTPWLSLAETAALAVGGHLSSPPVATVSSSTTSYPHKAPCPRSGPSWSTCPEGRRCPDPQAPGIFVHGVGGDQRVILTRYHPKELEILLAILESMG